jgi:hypothetical protein
VTDLAARSLPPMPRKKIVRLASRVRRVSDMCVSRLLGWRPWLVEIFGGMERAMLMVEVMPHLRIVA